MLYLLQGGQLSVSSVNSVISADERICYIPAQIDFGPTAGRQSPVLEGDNPAGFSGLPGRRLRAPWQKGNAGENITW